MIADDSDNDALAQGFGFDRVVISHGLEPVVGLADDWQIVGFDLSRRDRQAGPVERSAEQLFEHTASIRLDLITLESWSPR